MCKHLELVIICWLNCAKAQKPNVNNGLDTSKGKATDAQGKDVFTSADSFWWHPRVNSDPR
jgi:hypothetical protein